LVLVANCEEISLAVEDNGKGFDPNATEFNLGLCGMRERLELLGGTLLIESAPEQGTTLFARLPRPQEQP
jgi:signal transduction histidine kinase